MFWYSPEVPCCEGSGYDIRLYSPQSGQGISLDNNIIIMHKYKIIVV